MDPPTPYPLTPPFQLYFFQMIIVMRPSIEFTIRWIIFSFSNLRFYCAKDQLYRGSLRTLPSKYDGVCKKISTLNVLHGLKYSTDV